MMRNITKNKISISDIIEFVHKAMNQGLSVRYDEPSIIIINYNKEIIEFIINLENNSISIYERYYSGFLTVPYIFSDRDKLDLKTLELDIQEYNEDRALNLFNNFLTETEVTKNINDLSDED